MRCELLEEQGPAYALGALEPAEREALEAHAAACPPCTRELNELRQVAASLALGLPRAEPPARLGERIVAAARGDGAMGRRGEGEKGRRGDGASLHPRPRPQSPHRALALAALAVALAALLWGASVQAQLGATQRQLAETSAQLERIRAAYGAVVGVLASSETVERDLQAREGAPGARGKVWVDRASGQGMMMARDLPTLGEGQTYQVWLLNQQGRVSAGFLRSYDDGVYYVVLQAPGKLTDYQNVGVTREPAGGSPDPTGPRIIGGEI